MLSLRRKVGEFIGIGKATKVVVQRVIRSDNDQVEDSVTLGIEAPRDELILRGEVWEKLNESDRVRKEKKNSQSI